MVNRPDVLLVGQAGVFAEVDPPGKLRIGKVLPDGGQLLTGEVTPVQDERITAGHNSQGSAKLLHAAVG